MLLLLMCFWCQVCLDARMCFREGPGKLHESLLPQDGAFAGFIDFQDWMRGTWIPIYVIGMGRALPLDALQRVADRGCVPRSSSNSRRGSGCELLESCRREKNSLLSTRVISATEISLLRCTMQALSWPHLWITDDNAGTSNLHAKSIYNPLIFSSSARLIAIVLLAKS